MSTRNLLIKFCLIATSPLWLSSCLTDATGTESGTTAVGVGVDSPDISKMERTVCDPFQTNSVQDRERGVVGHLFYLTDDQPRYSSTQDYINHAHVADAEIYFDRLFVPTRPYDRPFYTSTGAAVTNASGETLYKYFGMKLHAQVRLAANENPGYYQLAVLSNDGAVLKVSDGNGGFKTLIDNDGEHPASFACATEAVYLDHDTKIPVELDYFQGDGSQVSLVTMWRPWPSDPDAATGHDSYCGRQGNGLFFKFSENPVTPQKHFYEMLAVGWKVLENENFNFPEQVSNPCAPKEDALVITGFSISGVTRDRVTLSWTTSIPAYSQGWAKAVTSGSSFTTAIDQTLVQNHSLTITGLSPNTLYSVKAISTSPGGQSATSDERAFRTAR